MKIISREENLWKFLIEMQTDACINLWSNVHAKYVNLARINEDRRMERSQSATAAIINSAQHTHTRSALSRPLLLVVARTKTAKSTDQRNGGGGETG